MSIEILDDVEWSEPISHLTDYTIFHSTHWICSEIKPQKNQSRLIVAPYNLDDTKERDYFVFYTPVLSSINGLEEYPHEIENTFIVRCKLSKQIACQIAGKYSYNKFWYRAKVKKVIHFQYFHRLVKPEKFNFSACYDYPIIYDCRYQKWLFIIFNNQSYAGFNLIFYESRDCLILVYFNEWIDKEIRSVITNYKLNQEERNLVYSWVNEWENKNIKKNNK